MTTDYKTNSIAYPDQLHELGQAMNEYALWRNVWDLRIMSEDARKHRRFIRDKLATSLDKICDILDVMDPAEAISSRLNYSREYAEEEAKNKKDKQ